MNHFTIGHRLPYRLSARLYGDRKRFGLKIQHDDPCWKAWGRIYLKYYQNYKVKSAGLSINKAGYKVMSRINMAGKRVLEIGPGEVNHIHYWNGRPEHYVLADVRQDLLAFSVRQMKRRAIAYSTLLMKKHENKLSLDENEFDVIVSFYCLEHFFPLDNYLEEMIRVLKPNGMLIGAIPTEGGLAWGLGRFITTRRWMKTNTAIDPDKIICWEHPNFAEDILTRLDSRLKRLYLSHWPLVPFPMDFNLVAKFIYKNSC